MGDLPKSLFDLIRASMTYDPITDKYSVLVDVGGANITIESASIDTTALTAAVVQSDVDIVAAINNMNSNLGAKLDAILVALTTP